LRWWTELQRLTASPEGAARTLEAFHDVDVCALAVGLDVPTLVMHAREDASVVFDAGRQLAALIPGARFVALETANHVLLEGEPAWSVFLDELNAFLAPEAAAHASTEAALTPAEAAVLQLVARGLDNTAIAAQLGKTEKTVRNQVSTIFDKLGVRTRAEAIVKALGQRS